MINRGQPIDRRPPPPSQSLEQSDRAPPPTGSNQRSPNIANQRHPSGNRVPAQIQQKEDFNQSFNQDNQNQQNFLITNSFFTTKIPEFILIFDTRKTSDGLIYLEFFYLYFSPCSGLGR